MDNPNDFIHIDDVFKRLKDREEPEPAGAWMRMQELLNEEMPVGAPAAGSMLRRYMIPLVALLLIGSGVAYYNLKANNDAAQNTSFANNNLSNKNSNTFSDNNALGNTASDKSTLVKTPDNNNGLNGNGNTVAAVNSHSDKNKNGASGRSNHTTGSHHDLHSNNNQSTAAIVAASLGKNDQVHAQKAGHKNVAANNKVDKGSLASSSKSGIANGNKSKHQSVSGEAVTAAASKQNTSNHNVAINSKSSNNNGSTTAAANGKSNATTNTEHENTTASKPSQQSNTAAPIALEQQNVVEEIYPGSSKASTVAVANNAVSKTSTSANGKGKKGAKGTHSNAGNSTTVPGMNVVAANWKNNKIVEDQNGSYYKEQRDTFKKIDLYSHMVASNNNGTKNYVNKIDTLAITRVERIKFTPLQPMEMVALREAKIIPQASIIAPIPMNRGKEYTVTNEMVNLVPLANYKVNSRKVDPGKFNQLINSTTQGISNYFDGTNKFYAAILLGGNTFMGNPSAFGMQLGIAGLYQLSERLTLDVEFKFANHYFSNYSINDQSVNYSNVSSSQPSTVEWLFKGTQTTTTSAYKINSFSELQFPVTLSYSLGRLSVFGGLNLAYAMPVKWNRSNIYSTQDVTANQNSSENPFLNQNFSLDEKKDFSSRFGMGYVGGFSYDINRKISLDARVTQNLWSSYSGSADAVNKLFKTPIFQFSIGYFFGRKERVVYIMDKR
jgi:hypothetical protein